MENKEKLIDKLLSSVPDLRENLKSGRYISIGHRIFKATAKLKNIRGSLNGNREYFLDFIEVPKEFVKDLNKKDFVDDIYKHYNLDYEFFVPCNIQEEYKFIVDDIIWNSYNFPPFKHENVEADADIEKLCPTTLKLFRHIYGDFLMMAIDYMTVEFNEPSQPLPVQVLYSRDNNTGKTTVLLHKRHIYGKNASIIDSGTFDEKFNSMIVGKNFIGIDEGKLNSETSVEKLKANVTNPTLPYREMRRSPIEVPNFGKYAIATNKDNWAKLDKKDSRFWVIKVPIIRDDYDPMFEKKLFDEAKCWTGFLVKRWELRKNRKVKDSLMKMRFWEKESRLWFLQKDYYTPALEEAIRSGMNLDSKSFLDVLLSWFQDYNNKKRKVDRIFEMYTTATLLRQNLFDLPSRITTPVIKNILERDLELKPVLNKKGDGYANLRFTDYFNPDLNIIQRSNVYLIKLKDITAALGSEFSLEDGEVVDANVAIKEGEQLEINHKK